MAIKKIETSIKGSETRVVLWVYCWDEFGMKDRPYAFKWLSHQVIFMFGGWYGEPRPIGTALTLEDAQQQAAAWLERWLKQCGAL